MNTTWAAVKGMRVWKSGSPLTIDRPYGSEL